MKGKPTVVNETQYDGRTVGAIVRWVFRRLELDGTRAMVKVKHHTGDHAYQGRIYYSAQRRGDIYNWDTGEWKEVGPVVPLGIDHLIVCRIGKPGTYPVMNYVYERRDAPEPWMIENWQEALVAVTAHEAEHLRLYRISRKGRGNESQTEWATYRLWKEWTEAR